MRKEYASLRQVTYQERMDDHPLVDRVFDLMQKKLHVWDAAELRNVVIEVCRDAAAYKPPLVLERERDQTCRHAFRCT